MKLEIEVKRRRISATQGEADIYVNGEKLATFGDNIQIVKDGAPYYGNKCGGWASTVSDAEFMLAAFIKMDMAREFPNVDDQMIQERFLSVMRRMEAEQLEKESGARLYRNRTTGECMSYMEMLSEWREKYEGVNKDTGFFQYNWHTRYEYLGSGLPDASVWRGLESV